MTNFNPRIFTLLFLALPLIPFVSAKPVDRTATKKSVTFDKLMLNEANEKPVERRFDFGDFGDIPEEVENGVSSACAEFPDTCEDIIDIFSK